MWCKLPREEEEEESYVSVLCLVDVGNIVCACMRTAKLAVVVFSLLSLVR